MGRTPKAAKKQSAGAISPDVKFDEVQTILEKGEERMLERALTACVKVHGGSEIGTGVFYSPQGHLLTSLSVVWDGRLQAYCDLLHIEESSGRVQQVEVISADITLQIAILKAALPGQSLLHAAHMTLGATGYIIGHSYDSHSVRVSKGLISYTDFPSFEAYIACADNGNSGGPVLDHNGRLRGIVLRESGATLKTTKFMPCISIAQALSRVSQKSIPNLLA